MFQRLRCRNGHSFTAYVAYTGERVACPSCEWSNAEAAAVGELGSDSSTLLDYSPSPSVDTSPAPDFSSGGGGDFSGGGSSGDW